MKIRKLAAFVLAILMLASMAASSSLASGTPEKVTMTCFFVSDTNDPDPLTNAETLELEALTGVHLDFTVVPTDGAKEKLNLMLASDSYPDIIMTGAGDRNFTNAELVKYGTDEKILIPLNDLIDKYAVNLKARFAEHPSYLAEMTTPDGNIYGIPSADSGITGHGAVGTKLWINTAWLDKLGLKMPTTTEEFKNVLIAFKTMDPNGNGKQDEIPLTGAINTWCGDPYLFLLNAFDYFYPYSLLKLKDGKISLTANTDGIREGLKYLADLYQNGLIDPAAFTQNEQQMAAIGNNTDAVIGGAATCGHLGMFVDINNVELAKQYDALLPLKGSNGYQGIPYDKEVLLKGAAFAITDKCKYPERAIQLADLFCSEDWAIRNIIGTKGVEWDAADPGKTGMDGTTAAVYKYLPGYLTTSVDSKNNTWAWSLRLVEPDWKDKFQFDGDIYDPTNYEARLYQATVKMLPLAADVQQIPPFYLNADESNTINQLQTALMDYVKASFVEFITGKKNIDTDWDAYKDGLTQLQADEYIRLNQSAYDALKK